jgi:hypothetical protein
MEEKTIKLSELKKISIKPGEVLAIKAKPLKEREWLEEVARWLGDNLKCPVLIVEDFDEFRVISAKKLKK